MHHSSSPSSDSKRRDVTCLLLLAVAVFLLFETSPTQGDFWWSDAPRHAMDGVFYYDMARAMPLAHLKQWAINYYLQYPAVTILTYPPLFALVEALLFAVFGVSHATAQLTVSIFFLATAWGAYLLARRWLSRVAALAAALLFIGTPAMALWGRQVMLEIPTFAFLLWSAYFFLSYLDSDRPRFLYFTVLLVLGAAYTKQPAVFILLPYLLTLYFAYRNALFRRRELWLSAVIFVVGMLPLGLYTWLWGRANVQQAVGGGWVKHSRLSPTTWSYVASYEWPLQMGWVVLALALVYCLGCLVKKEWRLPQSAMFFLVAWVAAGYVFFTAIAVTSQRYTIFLIFPFALFAILAIVRSLPAKLAPYVALLLAVASFGYTLAKRHVPRITGYRDAAQYVCSMAPANGVIMFSGWRDGSFVFNVRSLPECKNLTVIRADKLLLRVAIHRDLFGVKELGVAEAKLKDMIGRFGVHYIVIEPDFWNDLQSMQMLVQTLHQDQFKLLTTINAVNNREHNGSQLEIYENLGALAQGKNVLRVELPVSGIAVEGNVGQDKAGQNK
jgi:Dolichyl-phosphate-mannose-protein mannosyltransferase